MTKQEIKLMMRAIQLIRAGQPLPDDPYDLLDDPVEIFNARLHRVLPNRPSDPCDSESPPQSPPRTYRGPKGDA